MADRFYTLQLQLPCSATEVEEWWTEVKRVLTDDEGVELSDIDAQVSVVVHTDGTNRLTVHLHEVMSDA
jgi:hypothetical protein